MEAFPGDVLVGVDQDNPSEADVQDMPHEGLAGEEADKHWSGLQTFPGFLNSSLGRVGCRCRTRSFFRRRTGSLSRFSGAGIGPTALLVSHIIMIPLLAVLHIVGFSLWYVDLAG